MCQLVAWGRDRCSLEVRAGAHRAGANAGSRQGRGKGELLGPAESLGSRDRIQAHMAFRSGAGVTVRTDSEAGWGCLTLG